MKRQISPDLLRTFIAIAEEGSFGRAAERVGRTQSAVSMQIQRLEQMAGARLFTRHRPQALLTPKGEVMLGYARRMLQLQHEVWESLAEADPAGPVSFGIPDDYAGGILSAMLERFAERGPQVELSVICAPSLALSGMVERGELDLAVISRRQEAPKGRYIQDVELVWAASNRHRPERKETLPLAVFQEDCDVRRFATQALSAIGRPHRIAYSSPNLAALLAVTGAGLAVAAMPKSSLTPAFRTLGPQDGFPKLPGIELALLQRADGGNPAIRALADSILEK